MGHTLMCCGYAIGTGSNATPFDYLTEKKAKVLHKHRGQENSIQAHSRCTQKTEKR